MSDEEIIIANADMDGDAQATVTKSGASMRILQPGYDDANNDGSHPLTYLQLGAYPSWGTAVEQGDDLLSRVGLTTSSTKFFKDDHRYANGQTATDTTYVRDDGNVQTTSTPQKLTGELLTRGGFRLHTDGNYISTTRGDRIDVIFGNHHLAVLGRTGGSSSDDVWRPAFWESSGGHTVRDDVAQRGRLTQVAWDANRGAYKTYFNTLKGNHTVRFQGPLERVFACDTWVDKVGPTISSDGQTEIAATSARPHEQTDADTKWVNPSAGPGSTWPRAPQTPDFTETIDAKAIVENVKVKPSLGARSSDTAPSAGSITKTRYVASSESRWIHANSVDDLIYADSNAEVHESYGFREALVGGSEDGLYRIDNRWRMKVVVGELSTNTFVTSTDRINPSTDLTDGSAHIDVVGLQAEARVGVKLECTDFAKVKHPSWVEKDFWNGDAWNKSAGTTLMQMFWFGHGLTEYRKVVSTKEAFLGARASVSVSYLKCRWGVDHIDVFPLGARLEMSLFKAIGALVSQNARLTNTDLASFKYTLSGIKAKS